MLRIFEFDIENYETIEATLKQERDESRARGIAFEKKDD